jgi:hypothetical protein
VRTLAAQGRRRATTCERSRYKATAGGDVRTIAVQGDGGRRRANDRGTGRRRAATCERSRYRATAGDRGGESGPAYEDQVTVLALTARSADKAHCRLAPTCAGRQATAATPRRLGDLAAWRLGGLAAWRLGGLAAWRVCDRRRDATMARARRGGSQSACGRAADASRAVTPRVARHGPIGRGWAERSEAPTTAARRPRRSTRNSARGAARRELRYGEVAARSGEVAARANAFDEAFVLTEEPSSGPEQDPSMRGER